MSCVRGGTAAGQFRFMHQRRLTLVERFTRVDTKTLEYAYTVTDPRTWTSSWSVSLTFG